MTYTLKGAATVVLDREFDSLEDAIVYARAFMASAGEQAWTKIEGEGLFVTVDPTVMVVET